MTVQYARQIFMYSWDCARRRDSKRSGQVQETVESVPFILSFFSLSLSLVLKGDSRGSIPHCFAPFRICNEIVEVHPSNILDQLFSSTIFLVK